jgi:hypothetical protein
MVRDSEVNPCREHQAHLGEHKHPLSTEFDRCAPSVLAFSSRDAALSFARKHGGQVLTFAQWWGE